MLWMLFMMTTGGTPIPTGITYPTLDACYAAEEKVAAEYTRHYDAQVKAGASRETLGLLSSKKMRGICVPHEPAKAAGAK